MSDQQDSRYGVARLAATEMRIIAAMRQKLAQQFSAWERWEVPVPPELLAWYEGESPALDAMCEARKKELASAWAGTAVGAWVERTIGLGPAVFYVLSLAPELSRFENPAKLWRYLGLHAARATDRRYNKQLKAWCIFRLAEPCMKNRASPYRVVYDHRRISRPEMVPAGECATCDAARAKREETGRAGWDCHNMRGPHYKPAHAHVDALGVTAKAILRDAWRVSRGLPPRYGEPVE